MLNISEGYFLNPSEILPMLSLSARKKFKIKDSSTGYRIQTFEKGNDYITMTDNKGEQIGFWMSYFFAATILSFYMQCIVPVRLQKAVMSLLPTGRILDIEIRNNTVTIGLNFFIKDENHLQAVITSVNKIDRFSSGVSMGVSRRKRV